MKLKFFIAGLAIVAGLASAVSCQDLTKDLTDLKSKVASLESTVQALQSKIDAGAVITSVTPSNSGIKITLSNGNSYEITNGVNGKDGANGKDGKDGKDGADGTPGSVVTIGEDGNWYIDGVDTGLAAQGEDGEDGTPGAFFVPNPLTGCFDMYVWDDEKGEYVATPTEIPFIAEGTITAVYNTLTGTLTLYGVVDENGDVIEGGVTIGGSSAEGVTEIVFEKLNNVYSFFEATELDAPAFGPVGDQITFTAGTEVNSEASFLVKVTPATAEITKEDVSIINSKGETYDKLVVKSVEKFDDVLTKATDFALWKVVVGLSKYDKESFTKEVWDNTKPAGQEHVAFAVKIGEAVTPYSLAFEHRPYSAGKALNIAYGASDFVMPIYVNAKDLSTLRNRVRPDVNDYAWANTRKSVPTPAVAPVTTGDGRNIRMSTSTVVYKDTRTGNDLLNAKVGEPISITFDTNIYKAAYVELDTKTCDPIDPSEKNAWEKYAISGLNKLSTDGSLKVLVSDEAAEDDIIGFRVYAVNWDGTLADPDGLAFYAVFGEDSEDTWKPISATFTPAFNGSYGTGWDEGDAVAFSGAKLTGASTIEIKMDDNTVNFGVNFYETPSSTNPTGYVGYVDATGFSMPADWSKVVAAGVYSVSGTGIDYQSYIDNVEYTGTVTIKDAYGFVLAKFKVSAKKVLPTEAPAFIKNAIIMKSGALDDNGVLNHVMTVAGTSTYKTAADNWSNRRKSATGEYALMKKASGDLAKATTGYNYYEKFTWDNSLKVSDIYKIQYPTGSPDTQKKNIRSTFKNAKRFYMQDASGNVLNVGGAESVATAAKGGLDNIKVYGEGLNADMTTAYTTVLLALGAANTKGDVIFEYNYGKISTTIDADDNITKKGDSWLPVSGKDFKFNFPTTLTAQALGWDWNIADATAGGALGWAGITGVPDHGATYATVTPTTNWDTKAPNHNARVYYKYGHNQTGDGYKDVIWDWTMPVATAGVWDKNWTADDFDINKAPQLDYSANATVGYFIDSSTSEFPYLAGTDAKGNRVTLKSLVTAGAGYAKVAAAGSYDWGGSSATTVEYKLISKANNQKNEYYTPTLDATGYAFLLTKGTATAPVNKVEMTLSFDVYDEWDQKVSMSLPVVLVP